ncbi:hypothetical protein pb186bvf_012783 [Paramecium bursaria]
MQKFVETLIKMTEQKCQSDDGTTQVLTYEIDIFYGGCSDNSVELELLAQNNLGNKWIFIERDIVKYLKSLGLRMKTDPKAKHDRFYSKVKRKTQRASTTQVQQSKNELFNTPVIKPIQGGQVQIEFNSILCRRTPGSTPQSSPLVQQENIKIKSQQRKSIFNQLRKDSNSSNGSLDDATDYFKNL